MALGFPRWWVALVAAGSLAILGCDPSTGAADAVEVPTPTSEQATAAAGASADTTTASTPVPQLTEIAVEEGDWALLNGGHRNTRSRASGIDSGSVSDLEPAWSFPLVGGSAYGAAAGAPVVADGVVYLQDLLSEVYAIDVDTGEELWSTDHNIPISGPNGPAVADGRVFASLGALGFAAWDAQTGEELWAIELEKDGFQPTVAGGLVLVGTGALALVGGNSGFVHALDAATGEPRWSFRVIEDGFWGDPALNSGGGVWFPPAVDFERGLALVGTGNAGPYPGTVEFPNGSSRPGPNLYTSSLVALDLESGELRWYHQAVEHGLFDHDLQLAPVLTTLTIDGVVRDVAIVSGKLGRVLAIDLDTHEVLWDTEVGRHQNDDLTSVPPGEVLEVYPGIFGGVETPLAASGELVFVPVVNMATLHSANGHGAEDGSSALINAAARTDLSTGTGELVALRATTGEVVWRHELDSPNFGGATAIGDLVFTATFDGVIYAFRQSTGEELWRYDTGGGINAWPAVDGDTLLWPVGLGPTPELLAFRVPDAANDEGDANDEASE